MNNDDIQMQKNNIIKTEERETSKKIKRLIKEHKYNEAYELTKKYPHNPVIQSQAMSALIKEGRYEEAKNIGKMEEFKNHWPIQSQILTIAIEELDYETVNEMEKREELQNNLIIRYQFRKAKKQILQKGNIESKEDDGIVVEVEIAQNAEISEKPEVQIVEETIQDSLEPEVAEEAEKAEEIEMPDVPEKNDVEELKEIIENENIKIEKVETEKVETDIEVNDKTNVGVDTKIEENSEKNKSRNEFVKEIKEKAKEKVEEKEVKKEKSIETKNHINTINKFIKTNSKDLYVQMQQKDETRHEKIKQWDKLEDLYFKINSPDTDPEYIEKIYNKVKKLQKEKER